MYEHGEESQFSDADDTKTRCVYSITDSSILMHDFVSLLQFGYLQRKTIIPL